MKTSEKPEQKYLKAKADLNYYWAKSKQLEDERKTKEAELLQKDIELNQVRSELVGKSEECQAQSEKLSDSEAVQTQLEKALRQISINEEKLEARISKDEELIRQLRSEISSLHVHCQPGSSKGDSEKMTKLRNNRDHLKHLLEIKVRTEKRWKQKLKKNEQNCLKLADRLKSLTSEHERVLEGKDAEIRLLESELSAKTDLAVGLVGQVNEQTVTINQLSEREDSLTGKIELLADEHRQIQKVVEYLLEKSGVKVPNGVTCLQSLQCLAESFTCPQENKVSDKDSYQQQTPAPKEIDIKPVPIKREPPDSDAENVNAKKLKPDSPMLICSNGTNIVKITKGGESGDDGDDDIDIEN